MRKSLSAEYLAGLFDGEGCVNCYETTQHKSQVIVCMIEISNTHHGIIERIHKEHGGSCRVSSPGRLGRHRVLAWRTGGVKAVAFAHLILPHAVIKQEQLELFLKLRATVVRSGNRSVPEEVWRGRRDLLVALKAAKRTYLEAYA